MLRRPRLDTGRSCDCAEEDTLESNYKLTLLAEVMAFSCVQKRQRINHLLPSCLALFYLYFRRRLSYFTDVSMLQKNTNLFLVLLFITKQTFTKLFKLKYTNSHSFLSNIQSFNVLMYVHICQLFGSCSSIFALLLTNSRHYNVMLTCIKPKSTTPRNFCSYLLI